MVCGNLGAKHLSVILVFHGHMKHIEIDYYFVRESVTIKATN